MDDVVNGVTAANKRKFEHAMTKVLKDHPEQEINASVAEWVVENQTLLRKAILHNFAKADVTPEAMYWTAHGMIKTLKKDIDVFQMTGRDISRYIPLFLGLVSIRGKDPGELEGQAIYTATPTEEAKALYRKCFGDSEDTNSPGTKIVKTIGEL